MTRYKKFTKKLEAADIKAEIKGRAKHFYSIYRKMKRDNKSVNEIYDLSAVRILVSSVKDCYGGARRYSRNVEADSRAFQRLYCDAEVKRVPISAHDGHDARISA